MSGVWAVFYSNSTLAILYSRSVLMPLSHSQYLCSSCLSFPTIFPMYSLVYSYSSVPFSTPLPFLFLFSSPLPFLFFPLLSPFSFATPLPIASDPLFFYSLLPTSVLSLPLPLTVPLTIFPFIPLILSLFPSPNIRRTLMR